MPTMTIMPERDPKVRPGRNRSGSTIGKYLLVKYGGAGPHTIILAAADTDVVSGVTREDIPDQANGDLGVGGELRVTASGAISAGARIAPDAGGKVKAAASGDTVIGEARDAATADGDVIVAELNIPPAGFW
jgi:hypothetical protein